MKKELNYGINFHQTFPPTPFYIGRILLIADGRKMSAREISDETGIPQGESSGKVVPHLKYAAYMGLIESDISAPTLTMLGKTVLEQDGYCREELTQWIMHSNLCSRIGAPMWSFFVRDLLHNNHMSISKDYLSNQMLAKFGTAKYTPVITTYNEFSAINYLQVDKTSGKVEITPQRINKELLYMYGYELLREWDIVYPNSHEITAEELYGLACSECLGMNENQWFEVLEQLSAKSICRINKQLTPFTVVRLSSPDLLIGKLYSNLV